MQEWKWKLLQRCHSNHLHCWQELSRWLAAFPLWRPGVGQERLQPPPTRRHSPKKQLDWLVMRSMSSFCGTGAVRGEWGSEAQWWRSPCRTPRRRRGCYRLSTESTGYGGHTIISSLMRLEVRSLRTWAISYCTSKGSSMLMRLWRDQAQDWTLSSRDMSPPVRILTT